MGTDTTPRSQTAKRNPGGPWLRAGIAFSLLAGASGCLFGGAPAEGEIDPAEATEREVDYRTSAEKEQSRRFGDRMRRRTDLSEPVDKAADEPNE